MQNDHPHPIPPNYLIPCLYGICSSCIVFEEGALEVTWIQVLGGGFILLGMGVIIATPYQVKSTYSVSVPMGFWVLRQNFHVFGLKWSKEWHVNMALAQWVDSKTGKPVPASKETWLNGLVHKWILSAAEVNGEEVSHV